MDFDYPKTVVCHVATSSITEVGLKIVSFMNVIAIPNVKSTQ